MGKEESPRTGRGLRAPEGRGRGPCGHGPAPRKRQVRSAEWGILSSHVKGGWQTQPSPPDILCCILSLKVEYKRVCLELKPKSLSLSGYLCTRSAGTQRLSQTELQRGDNRPLSWPLGVGGNRASHKVSQHPSGGPLFATPHPPEHWQCGALIPGMSEAGIHLLGD